VLGVSAVASPGQVVPMEFTPPESGIYQINCGMLMMDPGYLLVTQ
jgi:plastocyanin domain-containing protein